MDACPHARKGLVSMKVGDLVKQVSLGDLGIITKVIPFGFYVLFPDGQYRVHRDDTELISESR